MALQLMTNAGANVTSKELDVRSVGTRMVPFTVFATGNDHNVTVQVSPTNANQNYLTLGTIAGGGGMLVVDGPIDYVKVSTDAAEGGSVNVFIATSR